MPELMIDPKGNLIPKDKSELSVWLAVHGESASGKAWLVSQTGMKRDGRWLPKSMCELGEPNGGFQRWDGTARPVLIPVHCVSMPKFMAVQKGLTP